MTSDTNIEKRTSAQEPLRDMKSPRYIGKFSVKDFSEREVFTMERPWLSSWSPLKGERARGARAAKPFRAQVTPLNLDMHKYLCTLILNGV